MPPVLLIAMMPISIAGWGVRESSMIAAFAYAGLAPSDGLTLSILFGAVRFAIGAVGGILWILSGMRLRPFAEANRRAGGAPSSTIAGDFQVRGRSARRGVAFQSYVHGQLAQNDG